MLTATQKTAATLLILCHEDPTPPDAPGTSAALLLRAVEARVSRAEFVAALAFLLRAGLLRPVDDWQDDDALVITPYGREIAQRLMVAIDRTAMLDRLVPPFLVH